MLRLNAADIGRIQNPVFARYAARYQQIYEEFMAGARAYGLDFAENREAELLALRAQLDALGVISRNEGASLASGRICDACEACRTGVDSYTGIISLMCHRNCFFCFNPNQYEYDRLIQEKKDWRRELAQVHAHRPELRFVALTGGEPMLHREEAVEFLRTARAYWPKASLRLYTSGDLLDEAMLGQLAQAGLEEIRFSLKLEDEPQRQERVFSVMEAAKRHVPRVMVEMPVLPDARAQMLAMLERLEAMQIFGINLLELCFPLANAQAFRERGYRLRNPPYRTLYDFWYAGGLPVEGSERLALELLGHAMRSGYRMTVHYCSLENKHFGQIYQQNLGAKPGPCYILSDRDFYLKTVKVFGRDAHRAERLLQARGQTQYRLEKEADYLMMSPACAALLKDTDMELGISYNVREQRGGETYIRELRLDYARASAFDAAAL